MDERRKTKLDGQEESSGGMKPPGAVSRLDD